MSALLARARLQACRHWPFASHAILSMVSIPRPGLGTLSVDQHWRLYYDEAALQEFGIEHAAGIILHEVDHLIKRHHKRGKFVAGNDAWKWDVWNNATDAGINGGLRDQGIPLPANLIYPETFNLPSGLSAEEYFRELVQQDEDAKQDQPNDSQEEKHDDPQEGTGGSDSQDQGRETNDGEDTQTADSDAGEPTGEQGQGDSDAEGQSAATDGSPCEAGGDTDAQPVGTSGSCSDGRQRPWELGPPDDDNPGLDESDQEQLIHETAKNVLEKGCGKGAGGHRRWAEDIIDPPLDPAAKLLNLVRRYCDVTVGVGERSYRRPSRRNGNPRMALPSNVAPLARITAIVDTSGSMRADDLGLTLGMIRKVLHSFRIRDGIRVVTGDTQGRTKQLCLSDPRSIDLTGGGGTDMSALVAEVLNVRPQPQMILVCTDGWTPWPKENPGVPIVACISRGVDELPDEYKPPQWIVTLELNGGRT